MALPTQMVGGLVSGLDTSNIVKQLMDLERRGVTALETRIKKEEVRRSAYQGVGSILSGFKAKVSVLSKTEMWETRKASTSNPTILGAQAGQYAQAGSYNFRVGRLAQAAQFVSAGFANKSNAAVAPTGGTIRIDSARSRVDVATKVGQLNGGQGIYHGWIRVTDRSGATTRVDLSTAESVQEVLDAINSAEGVRVRASLRVDNPADPGALAGDGFVLEDLTGGSGVLRVENYGGGTTADDLGLAGSAAGATIQGASVWRLGGDMDLAGLRGGLGIDKGTLGKIVLDDGLGGGPWTVDLGGAITVQDVIDSINDATAGAVTASVNGRGLRLQGAGGANLTVSSDLSADADNRTAEDLGLRSAGAGATLDGTALLADLNSVALGQLAGAVRFERNTALARLNLGAGVDVSNAFVVTDRNGTGYTIDLSGKTTVGETIDKFNQDTASQTRLTTFNKGAGVDLSNVFTVTDRSGANTAVNLAGATTAQDVVSMFNAATGGAVAVKLSIDAANGRFVITDTSGGGGLLQIESNNTTANLGIQAEQANAVVNGGMVFQAQVALQADMVGGRFIVADRSGATGGPLSVAANATTAALGIDGSMGAKMIEGDRIFRGGINGTGIDPNTGTDMTRGLGDFSVSVVDAATPANNGTYLLDVNALRATDSLADLVLALNKAARGHAQIGGLSFRVNAVGNGIEAVNGSSSQTYTFQTGTAGTTTAEDLGLLGKTAAAGGTASGGDLDRQYLSRATTLASLNGGRGVQAGSIRVFDAAGFSAEVNVAGLKTLGEVASAISKTGLAVRATLNATGDGLLLQEWPDQSASGEIRVEELYGGTAARDLGLLGSGKGGSTGASVFDGAFEKAVAVGIHDTLSDVMNRIAASGAGVGTSIISDGSAVAPYRLVLAAERSGGQGDFAIDSDIAAFRFRQTARGQDAVLLYGQPGSDVSPVMLASSTNTNTTAVLGLTLDLKQTSKEFATVSVVEDFEAQEKAVNDMVDAYNQFHEFIRQLTRYVDPEEVKKQQEQDPNYIPNVLFGDASLLGFANRLSDLFYTTVRLEDGTRRTIYDAGMKFTDEGAIEVDAAALSDTIRNTPDLVKQLFSLTTNVARQDQYASVQSSAAPAAGFAIGNLINGNVNDEEFGAGAGFESAADIGPSGESVTLDFAGVRTLNRIILRHPNSTTMPVTAAGLRDFKLEYLNPTTNLWEMLREVKNNKAGVNYFGFRTPTAVAGLRVTGLASNDTTPGNNRFRLMQIEAEESKGVAGRMMESLNEATNATSGFFAVQDTEARESIKGMETSIEKMNERLSSVETAYLRKFAAMETALAQMQSQSNYFSQQMASLNGSKK